jgi:hypothetical protein
VVRSGAEHVLRPFAALAIGALTSGLLVYAWGCGTLVTSATVESGVSPTAPDQDGASSGGSLGHAVDPDGGATCNCLPAVPDGWDGPLVADELADCAAPWADRVEQLHGGLDAGAHTCTCSCTTPPAECNALRTDQNDCSIGCGGNAGPLSVGACAAAATGSCSTYLIVTVDGGGPCTPKLDERKDPVGWARDARLCHGASAAKGVCDGAQVCVPDRPASGGYCIAHTGDLPCPPSWPQQRTYYDGADDTRGCEACSCGDGGAACEVAEYAAAGCNEAQRIGTQEPEQCAAASPFVKLLRGAASCVPDGGAPKGDVAPTGQRTVCCRTE